MDRAGATGFFESGMHALKEANCDMNSQNCEDWLIQAICDLSMAIRLTSKDEADYANYVQLIAAACAMCISKMKYSSDIDTFLSSSSTLATISTPKFPCTGYSGGSSVIDDQDLEEFGAQLDQVINRGMLATHQGILAQDLMENYQIWFKEAISCSSENAYLMRCWHGCTAILSYLRLKVTFPYTEVASCIESMCQVIELDEVTGFYMPPSEEPSTLYQILAALSIDSSVFTRRLSWLQPLAMHNAQR
jgi:hypothetical protein